MASRLRPTIGRLLCWLLVVGGAAEACAKGADVEGAGLADDGSSAGSAGAGNGGTSQTSGGNGGTSGTAGSGGSAGDSSASGGSSGTDASSGGSSGGSGGASTGGGSGSGGTSTGGTGAGGAGGTGGTGTGGTGGTGCQTNFKKCGGLCVQIGVTFGCDDNPSCSACPVPHGGTAKCSGTVCDFDCVNGFTKSGSTCVAAGTGGTGGGTGGTGGGTGGSGGTSTGGVGGTSGSGGTGTGGTGGTPLTLCCPSDSCGGGLFGPACVNGYCQPPLNLQAIVCDNTVCDDYCRCPGNTTEAGVQYTGGSCFHVPIFNTWSCDCHT